MSTTQVDGSRLLDEFSFASATRLLLSPSFRPARRPHGAPKMIELVDTGAPHCRRRNDLAVPTKPRRVCRTGTWSNRSTTGCVVGPGRLGAEEGHHRNYAGERRR